MSATARGWLACSVPIALWIAHLTAVAAIVEPICTHASLRWLPHALTVGLTLACVPFLAVAAQLVRRPRADDATETRDDLQFLGWLGLALGATSVLLIVAEGLMAVWVDPCR